MGNVNGTTKATTVSEETTDQITDQNTNQVTDQNTNQNTNQNNETTETPNQNDQNNQNEVQTDLTSEPVAETEIVEDQPSTEPADEPADEPAPEPVEDQPSTDSSIEPSTEPSTDSGLLGSVVNSAYGMASTVASYAFSSTPADVEADAVAETEEPYVAPIVGHTFEGKEMRRRADGTIDVDTSVPGSAFKEMYQNCQIVKLTNESCCHNGFEFKEGLNEDVNAFNYAEECGPDGLYFCTERDSERWFDYLEDITYVWDVEIPDDARVCVYDEKLKADKFVLSNRRTLAEFITNKVRVMVHTTGRTYDEIYNYIDENSDFLGDDYMLADQMKDLINIDPASYYNMPDYLRTSGVEAEATRLGLSQD